MRRKDGEATDRQYCGKNDKIRRRDCEEKE